MLNMDLKVNLCSLHLGVGLDRYTIDDAKLKKVGFFGRKMIKAKKGNTVYWAKNCFIKCFGKNINWTPMLDKSDGPYMCGTSAFVHLVENNIHMITCQEIGNSTVAKMDFQNISRVCTEVHGEPQTVKDRFVIWQDFESAIVLELSLSEKNCYFHWILSNVDESVLQDFGLAGRSYDHP